MNPEDYPNLLVWRKLIVPLEQTCEMRRDVEFHLAPDLASTLLLLLSYRNK